MQSQAFFPIFFANCLEHRVNILKAVSWVNNAIKLIDQTKLPEKLEYIYCHNVSEIWDAIKQLKVRGAPAIGIAAGYGVLLSALEHQNEFLDTAKKLIQKDIDYLSTSRPTAVNLFWVLRLFSDLLKDEFSSTGELVQAIQNLALAIHKDDAERCDRIGTYGNQLIPQNTTILTHCNTGALATGGSGTALGVIYRAHQEGKKIKVYADETRPLLQGSRLTAFELQHAGIDVTLVADNMASFLMQQELIDVIIVGADRIASNGDTANKIGTYNLAVNAYYHDIPFYIAAPLTTFDITLSSGVDIPIEERKADELRFYKEMATAPKDVPVYNPAFDITPHELITAIITDRGIIEQPNKEKVVEFYHKNYREPKLKELL